MAEIIPFKLDQGIGCGIMATYPEVANIAGLQGLLVYAIAGGLPMLLFSFLGPKIRRECPDGFVLTEWVFQRFGRITGLYLTLCTVLTLFLFMVSEVSSLQYAVDTLTGLSAVPVVIVMCTVTSIYTSIGGFKVSFITDGIQITFVFLLLIIMSCAIGSYIDIDTSEIDRSGLLKSNKISWMLVYILVVAIFTNDLFLSGFWLRTFASRSDKDLWIGCSLAALLLTIIATLVGLCGLLAVWGGFLEVGSENSGASFYILLAACPKWVSGCSLIMLIVISTSVMDSMQSSLTSTISNDFFRNKIKILYCRLIVVLIMFPVVVVGLKVANDVLQIFFIADLLSAAVIPPLILGLVPQLYFLTGYEVIGGGLGGLLCVFIFGTIYYDSAKEGGKLLLIWNGIYDSDDWGPFGAFVVAPFGGLLIGSIILGIRLAALKYYSIRTNTSFTALDKPNPSLITVHETGAVRDEESGDLKHTTD